MANSCVTPIKGTHLRMVKLDSCGIPVTGTSSLVITTKGFIQVQMNPQYEDGIEYFERTADGSVCVNQKDDSTLKRFELVIDLCEINVTGTAFALGARAVGGGAPFTTSGFAVGEGTGTNRMSLEVWQKVAGSGACDPTGAQRYVYNAWPNVGAFKLGAYTIQNDKSTLQFMGETAGAATQWGDGPGTGPFWMPAAFAVATTEHWLWNITTTALPTAACDPTTLT